MENDTIKLTIKAGEIFNTAMVDHSFANVLADLLARGEISLRMEGYLNMEKVGSLIENLPRDSKPTTTELGDLILFQGNRFVSCDTSNLWNFTRLGKINNAAREDLMSVLSSEEAIITLSFN